MQSETLKTPAEIANDHGVSTHKVIYVIRSRGIRPAKHFGHTRAFDEAATKMIKRELNQIAAVASGYRR